MLVGEDLWAEYLGPKIFGQGKAQIGNSGSRETIMDSNRTGRRRFLKQAAAGLATGAAGWAAGSEWSAKGQSAESQPKDTRFGHGEPSRFVTSGRGVRRSINHITYFTPIQDYAGIITPAGLHFRSEERRVGKEC